MQRTDIGAGAYFLSLPKQKSPKSQTRNQANALSVEGLDRVRHLN